MGEITLPNTEKYASLPNSAKTDIKKKFATQYGRGERYLEGFLDGSNTWTVERVNCFNALVREEAELQRALGEVKGEEVVYD